MRKYGRHEAVLSPKQRTLTQIAYAVPPSPGLRETDFLDLEQGQETDVSSSSRPNNFLAARKEENSASHFPSRGNQSKRRKTRHTAASLATASPSTSFHTQTLTQLVSRNTLPDPGFGDNDLLLGAMIQDSEDDDIPASPSPGAYIHRPSMSPLQHATGNRSNGATPQKPRADDSKAPSSPLFCTPRATRTEIPSSQPSPFTPMWRLNSPGSRADCHRTSPVAHKQQIAATLASPGSGSQALLTKDTGAHSSMDRGREFIERTKERASAYGEIPDSDEEETQLFGPYSPRQSTAPTTHAARQLGGQYDGDNASLLSSSPLSRPPSPNAEPASSLPDSGNGQASDAGTTLWTAGGMDANQRSTPHETPHQALHMNISSSPAPATCTASLKQQESTYSHPQLLNQQREVVSADSQQEPEPPVDTQQHSQALESQRVPLETIRTLGPQTDRSDIIISIHPEQIRKIVNGTKDHEFRNFKIPHTVTRFWMYATRPACELQYMAVVAAGFRQPGDIDGDSGIGNAEFNAGRLVSRYAYKLVQVYQLNNPVSLGMMQKNGWAGPPRRYDYLPPAIVGSLLGNLRCALFEESTRPGVPGIGSGDGEFEAKDGRGKHAEMSISQEIEAQLLSDIAETQQKRQSSLLPSSQSHPAVSSPYLAQEPVTASASTAAILSREAQAQVDVHIPSNPSAAWPSQATTVTEPTQDRQNEPLPRPALDPKMTTARPARHWTGKVQNPSADARTRRDSVSKSSNVGDTSQKQRPGRGSQKRPRTQRPRHPTQTILVSSSDSTQAALPDSLYEEVRQAPPAVIVDSEESDGE